MFLRQVAVLNVFKDMCLVPQHSAPFAHRITPIVILAILTMAVVLYALLLMVLLLQDSVPRAHLYTQTVFSAQNTM